MKSFSSASEESTLALGRILARFLKPGDTIALDGNLGAGKTVLSRGVARGLGITEPVTSPTFTVVQEYRLPDQPQHFFFHLDMYRIDSSEAALAFGIEDFLFSPQAITFVEWPERIPELLPESRTPRILLEHQDHAQRRISLSDSLAERLTPALQELATAGIHQIP